MSKKRFKSFSLIEVVVAVGVFAVGVVIVITLLGSMGSSVRAVRVETSADRILNLVDWGLRSERYENLEALTPSTSADFFSPRDELRFDPEKAESSFFEMDITPRTVPPDSAYLEFGVSVSWPVYREDGQFVDFADRKSLFFVTIVNR